MTVLDASVLIAHLNADDSCHSRAETALMETALMETAEHPLAASSITLAEVLVGAGSGCSLPRTRMPMRCSPSMSG